MKTLFVFVLNLLAIHTSSAVFNKNQISFHYLANSNVDDVGEPLFLTPYIQSGKISEARRLSQVNGLPNAPNITSFTGYLTVNKQYNSNTFFWFFPALNNDKKAPVLLWLQGGPGSSSMLGLFVENGPMVLTKDLRAQFRQYTWNQEFSLLYIDNPVGTGFSFTDSDQGYAKDQYDVARDLYEALQQFFTLFPEHRSNDFYVTGESYGGKYVPAIAYKIHSEGSKSNISLKGIAVGNGFCDPATMMGFGETLFQIGLLDENQRDFFISEETKAVLYIKNKQFLDAFKVYDSLINGDLINTTTHFTNFTGMTFYLNWLLSTTPDQYFSYYPRFLGLESTRRAIHVGNRPFSDGNVVERHIINDIMQSIKPWMAVLMDNYKVLIYSGQLDIIVATTHTENFVKSINWSKSEEYRKTDPFIWKVSDKDPEVAGYIIKVDKFYQAIIRNGGHLISYDQPRATLDLITKFVKNQTFN